MSRFYKLAVFVFGALFIGTSAYCAETAQKTDNQKKKASVSESANEVQVEEEAPAYDKLVPVEGWDRYSGDSARTIKGWCRWWKYLRMKQPVVMNWIEGLKLRVYPGNEVFRALFVRGVYDPNLIVTVNTLLHKGGTFIDVGANMGYFSLLASKVVGEDGRILAIEPSSRDFTRLVDNVNINRLENITPCRIAISDKKGMTKLSVACEERSSLNTLGTSFGFKGIEKVAVEDVNTDTIDAIVEKEGIKSVDVLKIDIEGSEMVALRGAKNTIEKFRPVILLGTNEGALSACGVEIKDLKALLKELRYKSYVLEFSPKFVLVPYDNIENPHVKVVFCMHESVLPPDLPQPAPCSITDTVRDFFTR